MFVMLRTFCPYIRSPWSVGVILDSKIILPAVAEVILYFLMLIVPLFPQVFNTTFYGIVDAMLLDADVMRSWLAASMDVNDFVHVNCAYLPRASGSGSRSSIVPVSVGVASSSAPLS